jgi:hypothetical protein
MFMGYYSDVSYDTDTCYELPHEEDRNSSYRKISLPQLPQAKLVDKTNRPSAELLSGTGTERATAKGGLSRASGHNRTAANAGGPVPVDLVIWGSRVEAGSLYNGSGALPLPRSGRPIWRWAQLPLGAVACGVTLRGGLSHSHAIPDLPYGTEPTYHLRPTGATASTHPTAIGELRVPETLVLSHACAMRSFLAGWAAAFLDTVRISAEATVWRAGWRCAATVGEGDDGGRGEGVLRWPNHGKIWDMGLESVELSREGPRAATARGGKHPLATPMAKGLEGD